MLTLLTLACASTPAGPLLFSGATLPGGAAVAIRVEDGRITAIEGSAEGDPYRRQGGDRPDARLSWTLGPRSVIEGLASATHRRGPSAAS